MALWMDRVWPTINDQPSARRAVERAARLTTLWAVVYGAIGLVSIFSGTRITERNPEGVDGGGASTSGFAILFCGIMFAIIAWKIRNMSRGWTLGGLVLAATTLLADLAESPSPI